MTDFMMPMENPRYKRIADTSSGNLIYLERAGRFELALRVEHPPQGSNGDPFPAAVFLHGSAGKQKMPLTDTGVRNQRCVDLGVSPSLRWTPHLALAPRSQVVKPDPGYLILVGEDLLLTSYYAGGRGERLYWNLHTGAFRHPGSDDFCFVAAWTLGITEKDGEFRPLATYPDDYLATQ